MTMPHLAKVFRQLRDLWCGGAVVRKRRLAMVRGVGADLYSGGNIARDAVRNISSTKRRRTPNAPNDIEGA